MLKSWYNQGAKEASRFTTIPKGTTLYRTADHICSYETESLCSRKAKCTNTWKVGIYFSTYILQSLGMCAEYNRDLELGVFTTTAPITVRNGKYSYRFIHPERHYESNYKEKTLGNNFTMQPDEIIGHFDNTIGPIITYIDSSGRDRYADMIGQVDTEGELFITEDEDLRKIQIVGKYKVNKDKLMALFKSLNWRLPSNSSIYLESDAIVPMKCPQNAGRKRRTMKNRRTT